MGQHSEKRGPAEAGDTVAFGKLDHAKTGDTLTDGQTPHPPLAKVAPHAPVLCVAVAAKERKDDVKLGQALAKLLEEDPSITVVHNAETHEVVLWGQGEMQLRVATERLSDRFGVATTSQQADGRLSRDHQEGHRAARPPQEAVGRSRPIRRCRARHQAVAARLGLHLHRGDQGRRRAAQLHPLGGGGRDRRAQARSARLPGRRHHGEAGRWLLSHRRLLGHGVSARRPSRHPRGTAAVPAGAARADLSGGDRLSVGGDREDERADVGTARPDSRLRHPRGLGRLGRGARADAGSRRSAI